MFFKKNHEIVMFFISISAFFLFSGCSQEPEEKNARSIRDHTKAAIMLSERGDLESARSKVKQAVRTPVRLQTVKTPAFMASGAIHIASAEEAMMNLTDQRYKIVELLDQMTLQVPDIADISVRIEGLQTLLESSEKEMDELDILLNGGGDQEGLLARLDAFRKQQNDLVKQKAEAEKQAQAAKDTVDSLQAQADGLMTGFELLSAAEKVDVQNEKLELLKKKKPYLLELQQRLDEIEFLEKQLELVNPAIDQLETDIDVLDQQIQEIETTRGSREITSQITNLKKQLMGKSNQITDFVKEYQAQIIAYSDTVNKITEFYDQAISDYSSLKRDRSMLEDALMNVTESQMRKAAVLTVSVNFLQHNVGRLNSFSKSMDSLSFLNATLTEHQKMIEEFGNQALDVYTEAIENYKTLQERTRAPLNCQISKGYLIAIYRHRELAEQLGLQINLAELDQKITELKELAVQCDPDFDVSLAARLMSGQIKYVPSMPVDSATYYEQMKKEFEDKIKLLPEELEERKQAAEDLLNELQAISGRDPEEYSRALGAIEQQLNTEMTREALEEAESTGFSSSDPNSNW